MPNYPPLGMQWAQWNALRRSTGRKIYDHTKPTAKAKPIVVENVDVRSLAFLKTYAWRRVRYAALKQADGRCECCGASPKTGARLNVDHIKPRKLRPDLALDPFNLQVLCDDCNAGKGNADQSDWR